MKKVWFVLLAGVLLCAAGFLFWTGSKYCPANPQVKQASEAAAQVHKLSPQQAKERMDSGDPLVIVDVRTQEEYDQGHIAGALLLPNEEIGGQPPTQLPDQAAEILVYCRSGNRSAQAAQKLVEMGYSAVYDFGGLNTWPYETTTE